MTEKTSQELFAQAERLEAWAKSTKKQARLVKREEAKAMRRAKVLQAVSRAGHALGAGVKAVTVGYETAKSFVKDSSEKLQQTYYLKKYEIETRRAQRAEAKAKRKAEKIAAKEMKRRETLRAKEAKRDFKEALRTQRKEARKLRIEQAKFWVKDTATKTYQGGVQFFNDVKKAVRESQPVTRIQQDRSAFMQAFKAGMAR